ncbi:MAG: phosphoribosyl-AMP cyclohydrolase [Candidatus Omnitrophota bacterium]|nr:phosphoribosyl-AMP cyclohydrolase [Candidatus Omnitrophota bacterium]
MKLKYDKQGLIPVIVQDYKTKEVLMLAYMNKLALKKTLDTGKVHFFSRSRKKLWLKGETSGHYQRVYEVLFDCDKDTLLIRVQQKGGACHMGYRSCFYRSAGKKCKTVNVVGRKVFDPEEVYKK